jgi:hypothetical protein
MHRSVLWIFLARIFPPSTCQTSILWRIDNTMSLAHIRKEGGLRGRAFLEGAERILLLAHQRQLRLLPAYMPSEENVQADAALRFHSIPDWHLAPRVFHWISLLRGPPQIDLFASRQSAQTRRFFSWNASDVPEAIDALSQKWDFKLAFLFSPIPLIKRVIRKLELSRGTFLLVTPYWDAQTWFASLVSHGRRLPSSNERRPHHQPDDRRASSKPGETFSRRLDDFREYWGVNAISDRSFCLIMAGWKQSSEDCYERAWQSFKAFLRSSSILFHQVSLRNVLDYLTHLYNRKLSWSTIGIHRSAILMMMAPIINSVRVGDHPLVKRLMSGVFSERPSHRAAPALWDPLKVLSFFQHWPFNLLLSSLMRKGAFLMAIATAKRPSELVALLCDDNHFRWEGEYIRFVPSCLTKSDRPGHLAPPFYVKP